MEWSRDGERVLTGCYDGVARSVVGLIQYVDWVGAIVLFVTCRYHRTTIASFSILTRPNPQPRVWNRDGTLEHSLASHDGAIFALRWSPSVRPGLCLL